MENKLTLTYTANTDLSQILTNVGDYINIFIPASFVSADYINVIEHQAVYGGRPYSATSDLVAVVCHMGILFPSEKPKKSSPNLLLTSPRALKFGKTGEQTLFDDTRRIDDDFKFYGVVVTVVAKQPLKLYPSVQGFSFASQNLNVSGDVSIDIVDFHFVSEFEPIPKCTNDPELCLMHTDNVEDLEYGEADDKGNDASFRYSKGAFDGESAKYLFKDFVVKFVCEDSEYEVHDTDDVIIVNRIADDGRKSTTCKFSDVTFKDNSVQFGSLKIGPIVRVIISVL